MTTEQIGHNIRGARIFVEVRLFNSISKYGGQTDGRQQRVHTLGLPAGSRLEDILPKFSIPARIIHLAMRNGRNVTKNLNDPLNVNEPLEDGDIIALSGPVPHNWGYGAPVV